MKWFPDHPPIYDITKTYAENAAEGPFFSGSIPKRIKPGKTFHLFGHEIYNPIGVPAGPLLNSKWVALAAKLGFDVPTYKTIRSDAHPGHELPNILYVEQKTPHIASPLSTPPDEIEEMTITNSFGMPSKSPDYLLQDIAKAEDSLLPGQVMIVSIVGTPHRGISFLNDFVRTALIAKEAGAKIIEANFSCPNVEKAEGSIYTNPDTVYEYAKKIARVIHPLPLVLKIGKIPSELLLKEVLIKATQGGARGICGLNSLSMEIKDSRGKHPLGEKRKISGVCGSAIRAEALQFLKKAHRVNDQEKLDLTLLGCGGIVKAEHFGEFFHAGADIAMTATGMMWEPYLAYHYQKSKRAT